MVDERVEDKQPGSKRTAPSRQVWHGIILGLFFLSGMAGLIYEVLWMRQLLLIFGSTTLAASTVVAAFMAGLAAGGLLFGYYSDHRRSPLRVYGWLEIGIGGYALIVADLFALLTPVYQLLWSSWPSSLFLTAFVRFGLAFLALLPPTILMGGTLPLLSRWLIQRQDRLGWGVGRLYGINTLGAVGGVVGAGFFMLPQLGMARTTMVTVGINILIGIGTLILNRHFQREEETILVSEQIPREWAFTDGRPWTGTASLMWFVLLTSGFTAMLYEMAWTRVLTLILGASTYAFTTMLAVFLVGLGAGSLWMGRLIDRLSRPVWTLARLQIGIGATTLLGVFMVERLPVWYLYLFAAFEGRSSVVFPVQFVLAAAVLLFPALFLGGVLPLAIKIGTDRLDRLGRGVGRAYGANTAGTVGGALAAGFVIMPALGIQNTLILGMMINFLLGLALLLSRDTGSRRFRLTAGIAFAGLIPWLFFAAPAWHPLRLSSGVYKEAPLYLLLYQNPEDVFARMDDRYRLLFHREGQTATVTVVERPNLEDRQEISLLIDGKVDASTGADMSTQVLSAHLPLLLADRVEDVLVIGFASGVTAGSVLRYPVRSLTSVEIEPAVIAASHAFDSVNSRPLDDPRLRLVLDDARSYLQTQPDTYDVVISEPSNPWMSGPARLFTKEFFCLGRDRLRPGGLFVQWLQVYGMEPDAVRMLVRTFQAVFPEVLVFQTADADLIMVGSAAPLHIDLNRMTRRMTAPEVAADLGRVGVLDPLDILVRFRLGTGEIAKYTGKGDYNTDDNGRIEFRAPISLHWETIDANLKAIQDAWQGFEPYIVGASGKAVHLRSEMAWRLFQQNDYNTARTLLARNLRHHMQPDDLWLSGELSIRLGDQDQALTSWETALRRDRNHALTLLSLARFYQERTKYNKAERYLQRLLTILPSSPVIRFWHGVNLYHLEQWKTAVAELSSVIDLGDTAQTAHGAAGVLETFFQPPGPGLQAFIHFYLMAAEEQNGHPIEAATWKTAFIRDVEQWRLRLEQTGDQKDLLALYHHFEARAKRGSTTEIDRRLIRIVNEWVSAPLFSYNQGVTAYVLGYFEDAAQALETYLHHLGSQAANSRAHYYLGLVYEGLGQDRRAIKHLRQFLTGYMVHDPESAKKTDARRRLADLEEKIRWSSI